MTLNEARPDTASTTRGLLWCGVVAGPLFIAVFLLEGATRAGYDPLRHPVSSLALGASGWMQVVNFVVAGALYLAYAAGLWRAPRAVAGTRTGALLVAAAAIGLLGAGAFITDPVSGYPPGTPNALGEYTTLGRLHDLFSIPTFLGIPAAGVVFGRWFLKHGDPGWGWYSIGSALAMLVMFVLTSVAFSQAPALVEYGGLLQRTTVGIGFAWLTALAIRTLRRVPGG